MRKTSKTLKSRGFRVQISLIPATCQVTLRWRAPPECLCRDRSWLAVQQVLLSIRPVTQRAENFPYRNRLRRKSQTRPISTGQRQSPFQTMDGLLVQGALVLFRQILERAMQFWRHIFEGNSGTVHAENRIGCVLNVKRVVGLKKFQLFQFLRIPSVFVILRFRNSGLTRASRGLRARQPEAPWHVPGVGHRASQPLRTRHGLPRMSETTERELQSASMQ